MRLFYYIIFLFLNLYSFNVLPQTIAVIDIQSLIDNNFYYNNTIKDIELNQEKYLKKFNTKENQLILKLKEIQDSKLILSEVEINLQIDDYNNQLSEFTKLIEDYNSHYEIQILNIRESILKEIVKLLEKYAIENNIDLILDSTSYLIASNSLDITSDINIELENIKLNLEFNDFENN